MSDSFQTTREIDANTNDLTITTLDTTHDALGTPMVFRTQLELAPEGRIAGLSVTENGQEPSAIHLDRESVLYLARHLMRVAETMKENP